MHLLLVCKVKKFLVPDVNVRLSTLYESTRSLCILPRSIRIIPTRRRASNGKDYHHGLESRWILWRLALQEELRADDEADGVAHEHDCACNTPLGVAGDVRSRQGEHHGERAVGEVGAVKCDEASDGVAGG